VPVYVCRHCWAVHTDDWFDYKWAFIHNHKTGEFHLERRGKREKPAKCVECRVCKKSLWRHSVDTAVEGTFEVLEDPFRTVSEDEYGQLYFLSYDVNDKNMPLFAVPVDRDTAERIAQKVREGYVVLKLVAGRKKILVFGVSKERKSDELMARIMREGAKHAPKRELDDEEKTGILAFT